MSRYLRIVLMVFAGLMAWTARAEAPADPVTPTAVIGGLQQTLLSVMKEADTLGYQGRYKKLEPVIVSTHDLPFIAKTAAGRYWGKLSADEQKTFQDAFTRLTLATYANQFDGYSGESFEVGEQQQLGSGGQVVVHGRLIKSDGSDVKFDYVLRQDEGKWRIINIVADGVSDLATKRAEYGAVIEKSGIATLIKQIEDRIATYASAH